MNPIKPFCKIQKILIIRINYNTAFVTRDGVNKSD